jgi:hypothetical protein
LNWPIIVKQKAANGAKASSSGSPASVFAAQRLNSLALYLPVAIKKKKTERLGKPPSYVAKYELGERRLDLLGFLDIAAAIEFDPGEVIRVLAN